MTMTERWLTIADIAEKTGIPEPTARRYARAFDEFIRHKKIGRIVRYPEEVVPVFMHIAALYKEGYTTAEIKEMLERERPRTIMVTDDDNTITAPQTEFPIEGIALLIESQNKLITELKAEIEHLRSELAEAKKEIAATVEKSVEDMKETLSRVERRRQEEQAKPWWRRWFR